MSEALAGGCEDYRNRREKKNIRINYAELDTLAEQCVMLLRRATDKEGLAVSAVDDPAFTAAAFRKGLVALMEAATGCAVWEVRRYL